MPRKRLPCTEERANREHELIGENPIGRHVWRCTECGAKRVGPFADRRRAVADGGEPDA